MSYISLGVNFNVSSITFLQVGIIEHRDKGFLSHCIIYKTPELDTNRRAHEPWIALLNLNELTRDVTYLNR